MATKRQAIEEPKGKVEKALRSWRAFLPMVSKLSETELAKALDYELATKRRKMIVVRLQMRLRKVRGVKERNRMNKHF